MDTQEREKDPENVQEGKGSQVIIGHDFHQNAFMLIPIAFKPDSVRLFRLDLPRIPQISMVGGLCVHGRDVMLPGVKDYFCDMTEWGFQNVIGTVSDNLQSPLESQVSVLSNMT